VPQGSVSPGGPSLGWQRFTLSCYAIHLVNIAWEAGYQPPSAIVPVSPQGAYFWGSAFAHPRARAGEGRVKRYRAFLTAR
jgi:hypothetical protein